MNSYTRLAAGLAVTVGLLAACGGSDGNSSTTATPGDEPAETLPDTISETDPPATEPLVTEPSATEPASSEPAATDPPTTEQASSDLPDWASGEFVTVESDTGPLELPVEIVAFCESSRSFYLAARGLDFISEEQPGTAREVFAALAALVPATIDTAPSDDFAIEPTAAQEQLAVIIPAFEEIDFAGSRTAELSDPDTVSDTLQEFFETRDSLRTFLVQACGADDAVLDQQSRDVVATVAQSVGEAVEPDEPVDAVPGSPVTNANGTITVSTPDDWTETDESVQNGRDQLVVSSDLDGFSSATTPGVLVLRGEGGFRDGGFVGRVLEFESDLEGFGCVLVDEDAYDDGVYQGEERVYDCNTDGLDVRLLGGTNADESLYAMVFLVHPSDVPGVRQLIVDTFQVA